MRIALIAIASVLATAPAMAQEPDPQYKPGPWHYKSVACVDTTIRQVTGRAGGTTLADFRQSGVIVIFATRLGVDPTDTDPKDTASVVHYQDTPGNDIMGAERAGDRVQVCFLGGPAPTIYCDPDKDGRGRSYRVWDYRQHAQYWGGNSEHACGGA